MPLNFNQGSLAAGTAVNTLPGWTGISGALVPAGSKMQLQYTFTQAHNTSNKRKHENDREVLDNTAGEEALAVTTADLWAALNGLTVETGYTGEISVQLHVSTE